MRDLAGRYWRTLTTPSEDYSLGFLTIGGFSGGIVFWGAFNTAMEFTNTEQFCIGCHVMRDNVYQEIQPTIHFTNPSGGRAKGDRPTPSPPPARARGRSPNRPAPQGRPTKRPRKWKVWRGGGGFSFAGWRWAH